MNKDEISEWLDEYGVKHYTINEDLSVDVNGSVILTWFEIAEFPFKFNIVNGDFFCYGNHLTSLEGCPKIINGSFSCYNNLLTSLEGCPKIINGSFSCYNNLLTSLEGCPKVIKGYFHCDEHLKKCKEYKVHQMIHLLRK